MIKYSPKGYKIFFKIRPFFVKLLRIKVSGVENIPLQGGCILAANHRSNLDPFVLNSISPRPIFFMAKEELFKIPVLGWIIRKAGAIPVKRNKRDIKALKLASEALKEGFCVGIFPEGHRARPKEFRKPQSGVGLLVFKNKVPVVPIRIEGTDDVFPVGSKFPKLFKYDIEVKIGKPIFIDNPQGNYQEIANIIMEHIKSL
ncbi:MAG: 1-acyl-sn-glycerol-3-phosphate acyltransferase [Aquificota bacterium]|nr:MAG: 1-acyl-sn-glycerol-3-phosphate acyltransferase [Aquificota bacterium]